MTPLMSKIQLLKNEIFHLYGTRNAGICPSVEENIGRANSLTSFAVGDGRGLRLTSHNTRS
jgi:hypothetical protein